LQSGFGIGTDRNSFSLSGGRAIILVDDGAGPLPGHVLSLQTEPFVEAPAPGRDPEWPAANSIARPHLVMKTSLQRVIVYLTPQTNQRRRAVR